MVPGRPVRMGLMNTAGASVRACSREEEGQEAANREHAGCERWAAQRIWGCEDCAVQTVSTQGGLVLLECWRLAGTGQRAVGGLLGFTSTPTGTHCQATSAST
jgi:hypothetical protein